MFGSLSVFFFLSMFLSGGLSHHLLCYHHHWKTRDTDNNKIMTQVLTHLYPVQEELEFPLRTSAGHTLMAFFFSFSLQAVRQILKGSSLQDLQHGQTNLPLHLLYFDSWLSKHPNNCLCLIGCSHFFRATTFHLAPSIFQLRDVGWEAADQATH